MKGRTELKHALTQADYYMLRSKLQHVMRLDPNANANGKYLIRSIYFDNFDNKVVTEKKEGFYQRDKYRVRLYNFNFDRLHLEKKSKRNNITFKTKCRMDMDEYERIRTGDLQWMENDERALIKELYWKMTLFQFKPITVVDYERETYIYEPGNVRITFDSSIKTSFRNNDLLNKDLAMIEAVESELVVLEVKYDSFLPDIIKLLLQGMDRRREAFSKYQISRMYG